MENIHSHRYIYRTPSERWSKIIALPLLKCNNFGTSCGIPYIFNTTKVPRNPLKWTFFLGGEEGRHHMHLFFIQLYIRYCGGACQQRDWPNHKRVCREKRRPFFFTASSSQFCDEPDRWYELLTTLRMGPSFHEYNKKNLLNSMCLEWNKSKVFFFHSKWIEVYNIRLKVVIVKQCAQMHLETISRRQ